MIVLLSGTMTYEGWGDGFYSNRKAEQGILETAWESAANFVLSEMYPDTEIAIKVNWIDTGKNKISLAVYPDADELSKVDDYDAVYDDDTDRLKENISRRMWGNEWDEACSVVGYIKVDEII